jgi:tetratricopeptide (TPR) repeat protein
VSILTGKHAVNESVHSLYRRIGIFIQQRTEFISRGWLVSFGLIVVTVIAYLPARQAGFIWDDDIYVTQNSLLTAPNGLERIWFSLDSPSQYFPLTYTFFYFERLLWGLNPFGYHLVNVLFHALNAILVWKLLLKLGLPGAWLGAMLFALHPVQVESVAWITELKNLLMCSFFLVALLSWVAFTNNSAKESWKLYALALLFYVLALCAKTTACTLPAALILVLWLKRLPLTSQRLLQIVPFIFLGCAMGLLTVWWERFHQHTQGDVFSIGPLHRILIAVRAIWFYLGKLLWPTKLIFSYPRWEISLVDPAAYGWLFLTAIVAAAIWRCRELLGRVVISSLLFFIITLSPVLGFIMLYTFRYTFVADHYQYVACIGPLALLAGALDKALTFLGGRTSMLKGIVYCLLLTTLGTLTSLQCFQYKNLETLWRATVSLNPASWMAHENLGNALSQEGKISEAIMEYRRDLDLKPDSAEGHNDLGAALMKEGKLDEAIFHYLRALELHHDFAKAHYNLGNAWVKKGRLPEAAREYQIAVKLRPEDLNMNVNLANANFAIGHLDEAINVYRHALEISPENKDVNRNLARLLLIKGKPDAAMNCLRKVFPSESDPAAIWDLLGNELLEDGDCQLAVHCFENALLIRPQFSDAKADLGLALLQAGRPGDAIKSWEEALALTPDMPHVQNRLAWLLATSPNSALRDGAKALALSKRANEITGGQNPFIWCTLAAAYGEVGQYAEATKAARRSLELAKVTGNKDLIKTLESEISLFQDSKPMRESGQ